MPVIDIPMEKLAVYGGRNPQPFDFNEYWGHAPAEMRGVKPEIEWRPSDFHKGTQ